MSERLTPLLPLIGWLMLAAVLLSVGHGLGLTDALWSGVCAWLAGLLLFSRVAGLLRIQVLVIMTLGTLALWWGAQDQAVPWGRLLTVNHNLIAMLMAVSFLRLMTSFKTDPQEQLPTGRKALWRTLLGVHLFGAVINMSTLLIVGDRLARRQPLTPLQGMLLSRGFATVSYTHLTLPTNREVEALWLPGLLALLVLAARLLWPQIAILTWVSLLSLLLCLIVLVARQGAQGLALMRQHTEQQLPRMSGEISLFLAAGVLSVGLAMVVQRSGFELQLAEFGPWQAWGLLLVIVVAAVFGIHPLISTATSSGMLAGQVADPNLLGITYLMGWALGVMASPVSGTHLTLQARFGLPSHRFFKWNLGFVIQLLLIDLLMLQGYALVANGS